MDQLGVHPHGDGTGLSRGGVGSRTASGTHGGEIARVKLAGVGEVEVVAGIGLTAELLEVVGGDRPAFGVGEGLVVVESTFVVCEAVTT